MHNLLHRKGKSEHMPLINVSSWGDEKERDCHKDFPPLVLFFLFVALRLKLFPKIGPLESIAAIASLGGKRAISQFKVCLQIPKLCLTFLIPFRLTYRSLDTRLVPLPPRYCLFLMRWRGCSPATFELKAAECTSL